MSAQDLSNACEALGYPIPRSTIANIESGRKETVSLQELLVIAKVLNTPPLMLIYYPFDASQEVQIVPGDNVLSVDAAERFGFSKPGESHLGALGEKTMILRGMEEAASLMVARANSLRSGRLQPEAASQGTRMLDEESISELAQQEAVSLDKAVTTLIRKASNPRRDLIAAGIEPWDPPSDLAAQYAEVASNGND